MDWNANFNVTRPVVTSIQQPTPIKVYYSELFVFVIPHFIHVIALYVFKNYIQIKIGQQSFWIYSFYVDVLVQVSVISFVRHGIVTIYVKPKLECHDNQSR